MALHPARWPGCKAAGDKGIPGRQRAPPGVDAEAKDFLRRRLPVRTMTAAEFPGPPMEGRS